RTRSRNPYQTISALRLRRGAHAALHIGFQCPIMRLVNADGAVEVLQQPFCGVEGYHPAVPQLDRLPPRPPPAVRPQAEVDDQLLGGTREAKPVDVPTRQGGEINRNLHLLRRARRLCLCFGRSRWGGSSFFSHGAVSSGIRWQW